MRFRHIEIFHAVYSCGSISKAAEFLNVSQPSVSKVLQHAEVQLGFKLFHRVKGRLAPTNRAVQLFQEVEPLYRHLYAVRRTAKNLRNDAVGKIRLAASPAFAFSQVPRIISKYRQQYEDVTFDIQTRHFSGLVNSITEHDADLAIGFGNPMDPRLLNVQLGEGKVMAISPRVSTPPLPATIDPGRLEDQDFISITESGPLGNLIAQYLSQHKVRVKQTVSAQTYFLAAKMVSLGLGTALLDEYSVSEVASEHVRIHHLEPAVTFPVVCFYHADKPLRGLSKTFLDFLIDWCEKELDVVS